MSDPSHAPQPRGRVRSSEPVWKRSPRRSVVVSRRLPDRSLDAIVVGAGISGALVAQALANGRRSVAVLDKATPGEGSTLASTAMIQSELDTPLSILARAVGADHAARAWRRSAEAVGALERLARRLDLDCGFERRRTLYLAGEEHGARALATEVEARRAAGLEARLLDRKTLRSRFGIERPAAIETASSAAADPAKLTAELLRRARANGATIHAPLEVAQAAAGRDGPLVSLSDGSLLGAKTVVFCTGYHVLETMRHASHRIVSTWAFATGPMRAPPSWLPDYTVWEASDPYVYFRTDSRGRLIGGGEDVGREDAHRSAAFLRTRPDRARRKIEAILGRRPPPIRFRWSAAFGSTTTGLPIIAPVPGLPGGYVVMGYGGNGLTSSVIAAQMIARWARGETDRDAAVFAPR